MNVHTPHKAASHRCPWQALLLMACAMGLSGLLQAQVAINYPFSQSLETYTPLTGGTLVATYAGSGTGALRMDDVIYNLPAGTIPFNFIYDGTAYTGLNISTNGFLTFGATAPTATTYSPLSATIAYAGAVSPFGRDLEGGYVLSADRLTGSNQLTNASLLGPAQVGDFIDGTGIPAGTTITAISGSTITISALATTTGTAGAVRVGGPSWSNIQYATLGSPGSQVFVVQWSGFKRFGTFLTTVQHMTLNFQVRLYEVDNRIEIVYGNNSPGLTTTTIVIQVGLRGPNNTFATNVNNRLNTKNVNDDWLLSVAGTANTSGMVFNNVAPANVIADGLTYRWEFNPPCFNPQYTVSFDPCATPGSYTLTVDVTDLGDAPSIDITSDVDGVLVDDQGVGNYVLGPFAFGTVRTFTLLHNGNSICDQGLGSYGAPDAIPGDNYWNAIPLTSCPAPVPGTTINSTVGPIYTNCGAGAPGVSGQRGVWYRYPGDNNSVTVNTCATPGFDTRLTVYSGTCGNFTCVGGNDDMGIALCPISGLRSQVTFNANAGTDYWIFVHGFGSPGATGDFVLNFICSSLCVPIPANDDCANAQPLTNGVTASSTNECASATSPNPTCESSFATLPDVYFSFTYTNDPMILRIDLGTASSLGYALYASCGGTQVACLGTVTSGLDNLLPGLTLGNTYIIRVNTDQSLEGTFDITVFEPPPTGPCCSAHTFTGCENAACQAAVCAVDSFCCTTQWDSFCAGEAIDNANASGACNGVSDCPLNLGACCTANGTPQCEDAGCTSAICAADSFCCTTSWDGICAGAAVTNANAGGACAGVSDCPTPTGPCCTAHAFIGCEDATCEAAVCALDPFCCNTQWDGACAALAIALAGGPGDPCFAVSDCPAGGPCCTANGSPGCENAPCEAEVCAVDSFCCTVEWDSFCAGEAVDNANAGGACSGVSDCPTSLGPCCTANGTPQCEDAGCTAAICAADTFCCTTSWDGICAGAAVTNANAGGACAGVSDCPTPTGPCCSAHAFSGCENATCEAAVCNLDPFCCNTMWDGACAGQAIALAGGPGDPCFAVSDCPAGGPCCTANGSPGCENAACEAAVCAVDSFCCNIEWDGICAGEAISNATSGGACAGVSDCPSPPGQACGSAIPIDCFSGTQSGSTAGVPNDTGTSGAPFCVTAVGTGGQIWYEFTSASSGTVVLNTCGSTFDTKLHVYSGICGALVCVTGNDDFCGLQSQVTFTATAGTPYLVRVGGFGGASGSYVLNVISCPLPPPPCVHDLVLELQLDNFPTETTWSIIDDVTNLTVFSGGPYPGLANQIVTENICVDNGCYRLVVNDSFGDGMQTGGFIGGYVLRTLSGDRIIDNSYNFDAATGFQSTLAAGESWCLPLGSDRPIFTSCDRNWWQSGNNIVATENAAVSAVYASTNNTAGYEFWFFDPNGDYSFRILRTHAAAHSGYPFNPPAIRAAHIPLNSWSVANHLQEFNLYNVRIRGIVAGVPTEDYGPACTLVLDPILAQCPPTGLQNIPGHPNFSCGVTRTFGGPNSVSNRIHARATLPGANRYEFEFSNANESYLFSRFSNNVIRHLNWPSTAGPALNVGSTYQVRVRSSNDNGATWCDWGWVCDVTIAPSAAPGQENIALESYSLNMWPNPNNGDQVWLAMDELPAGVETVAVDIYDLSGKRIVAREVATQGGHLYTNMSLNGDLAAGVYLVNIIAGDVQFTQRLVVQP